MWKSLTIEEVEWAKWAIETIWVKYHQELLKSTMAFTIVTPSAFQVSIFQFKSVFHKIIIAVHQSALDYWPISQLAFTILSTLKCNWIPPICNQSKGYLHAPISRRTDTRTRILFSQFPKKLSENIFFS
jgi:hypothetical protein